MFRAERPAHREQKDRRIARSAWRSRVPPGRTLRGQRVAFKAGRPRREQHCSVARKGTASQKKTAVHTHAKGSALPFHPPRRPELSSSAEATALPAKENPAGPVTVTVTAAPAGRNTKALP